VQSRSIAFKRFVRHWLVHVVKFVLVQLHSSLNFRVTVSDRCVVLLSRYFCVTLLIENGPDIEVLLLQEDTFALEVLVDSFLFLFNQF